MKMNDFILSLIREEFIMDNNDLEEFTFELADKFRNKVASLNNTEKNVIESFEKELIKEVKENNCVSVKSFKIFASLVETLSTSEEYKTILVLNKLFMDVEDF